MSLFYNLNKFNKSIINISYEKIKINYFFLNHKFILFISLENVNELKNKILNYNLSSMVLKKRYIKSLFNLPNFYFFGDDSILCIFFKNDHLFLDFIKFLENKQFFYSYLNRISNITNNNNIISEYSKYNNNYIYIQFILKKLKIKIILLFLFFLFTLIKYIK